MKDRKIIHIDMDAFYAAIEQLDFPELRGKPIAVGGNAERGVVATASYEARKYGVKSAMSSKIALKKCPELIFVKPRFYRYQEISQAIHAIFRRYTDVIEPLSMDEAFLDVTDNKTDISSATFIAQSIKNDIRNELNLVASAGVSFNKFLAKLASDQDKPDGLFVIQSKEAQAYLDKLPVDRFFGVGKVTAEKLKDIGVTTGKDLRALNAEFMHSQFGKLGSFLFNVARGIDHREVKPERVRKSIAVENTFDADIEDMASLNMASNTILNRLWERYEKHGIQAKTLSVKVKFNDFKIMTRSHTISEGIHTKEEMVSHAKKLFMQIWPLQRPVRLMGYQFSNFLNEEEVQEEKIPLIRPGVSVQLTFDF